MQMQERLLRNIVTSASVWMNIKKQTLKNWERNETMAKTMFCPGCQSNWHFFVITGLLSEKQTSSSRKIDRFTLNPIDFPVGSYNPNHLGKNSTWIKQQFELEKFSEKNHLVTILIAIWIDLTVLLYIFWIELNLRDDQSALMKWISF